MYLSEVYIENFRCFHKFRIRLDPTLSVLVGENNIGKTNLLAAIGLIFPPEASPFSRHLSEEDIWTGWRSEGQFPTVKVQVTIEGLRNREEKALVQKWLLNSPNDLKARITYEYRPAVESPAVLLPVLPMEEYDWTIYGGEVEGEQVDLKRLGRIRLELLPALRDAEREMSRGRHRRLGALISGFKPEGFDEGNTPDKRKVTRALGVLSGRLERAAPVAASQEQLNVRLRQVSGEANAQEARFSPSRLDFDDLIRNLQVLVGPSDDELRSVELNGLGYNNLLYVAALLTDFYRRRALKGPRGLTVPIVAVEEPEAHLHPHLQKFLNHYFAGEGEGQVIVTTHSTHVSSSVDPRHLVVMHRGEDGDIRATSIAEVARRDSVLKSHLGALRRYLDATRSTLFFGKSVMLVEGLSEAILLPVVAKACLHLDVNDRGISVVAVQGISFRPFASLFGRHAIQRRCAILADSDPGKDRFPLSEDDEEYAPAARVVNLRDEMRDTKADYVRVFTNLKTLEHDIIVAGNRDLVVQALERAARGGGRITPAKVKAATELEDPRDFSRAVLTAISDAKGEFAQVLADVVAENPRSFRVPQYICDAFAFVSGEEETVETSS